MSELAVSKRRLIVCAVLVGLIVVIYGQTCLFDFVNYDDQLYVYENAHTKAGLTFENVRWAFTTRDVSNWHPLTWLSDLLDIQVFGENPGAMHGVNVFFHTINTLLLFLWLSRMTRALWPSAFVAALFAVHPLHVESVAWVTERKDVLSTAFWLLTMLAYVRYVQDRTREWYLAMVAAFALGLMAKPMLVSLPLALLIMDYWPLGRFNRESRRCPENPCNRAVSHSERSEESALHRTLKSRFLTAFGMTRLARYPWAVPVFVIEKLPLFAIAAASCIVTYWVQKTGGAVHTVQETPFGPRVANAVVSYVAYLCKTFYPAKLAIYYPHPGRSLPVWEVIACGAALAVITALVVRARKDRPYLLAGWLWYVVTLIPVIGIVQVGEQAMADRYSYVPLVGVFFAIAWAIESRARWAVPVSAVLSALAVAALTVCCHIQVGYWSNAITLFSHTLKVTSPRNSVALYNLGVAYSKQGDDVKASQLYRAALRVKPRFVDAHYNLGNCLRRLNRPKEAWSEYLAALKIYPRNALVHANMGYLLSQQGRINDAISEFRKAMQYDPSNVDARFDLEQLEAIKRQRDE